MILWICLGIGVGSKFKVGGGGAGFKGVHLIIIPMNLVKMNSKRNMNRVYTKLTLY